MPGRLGRGGLAQRYGPGRGVILRGREIHPDRLVGILAGSSGQDVAAGLSQLCEDNPDLLDALAGAVDHFREPATDRPMVVDVGEAGRFERQPTQAVDGLLDARSPGPNRFEQPLDRVLVHGPIIFRPNAEMPRVNRRLDWTDLNEARPSPRAGRRAFSAAHGGAGLQQQIVNSANL